ncbi:hypothetical protein [Streptomyces griseosporeus]|uniref:hypothetical protein n=1 Tax=Streptomyces griseosporeus TaxID=1910 RepID=UPI0037A3A4D2
MNPRMQQPGDVLAPPPEMPDLTLAASVSTTALTALQTQDMRQITWSIHLAADICIRREARARTRMRLTVSRWTGDIDTAARVAAELADNGSKHGQPFPDGSVSLRLGVVPESGELLVEVDDAAPFFPQFSEVVAKAHGKGSGLGFVQYQHATINWYVARDDTGSVVGKIVQAVLPEARTKAAA